MEGFPGKVHTTKTENGKLTEVFNFSSELS